LSENQISWQALSLHARSAFATVAVALGVACVCEVAGGQSVSSADYGRATALLKQNLLPLLRNAQLIPHWLRGSEDFWYRRETAQGYEFVRVDSASGIRTPLFDHVAMARELSERSGVTLNPNNLPFESVQVDSVKNAIQFEFEGAEYRCAQPSGPCTRESPVPSNIVVSPDGRTAALIHSGNLWIRDLPTGAERQLTQDGELNNGYGIYYDGWQSQYIPRSRLGESLPPFGTFWSPDGRRLIVPRIDQRHIELYPFIESGPLGGGFRPKAYAMHLPLTGEKPAVLEWYVIDVATGHQQRIAYPYDRMLPLQADVTSMIRHWWSTDARHLYTLAYGDEIKSAYVFDADLVTGSTRIVIEETQEPRITLNGSPDYPPNVVYLDRSQEFVWFSERDGWGHLYLYDARTGRLKNRITRGAWLVRDIMHIDADRRQIYFTGSGRESGNPYYRYLYRVGLDGSNLTLLTPEPVDHPLAGPESTRPGAAAFDPISPSSRYLVYVDAPFTTPPRTLLHDLRSRHTDHLLEAADATQLFASGYRPPQEVKLKAADGKTDLWAVLYTPPRIEAGQRYPIVDVEYASPLRAVAPHNFLEAIRGFSYAEWAPLAELGFYVVCVDARGTAFRSHEFSAAPLGFLNHMGLEDHITVIRQLAAQIPSIDLDRVGITGTSYGGWTVLRAMLAFPAFFKVGVAGVPPGTMHSMYADYEWEAFQGKPTYQDGSHLRPGSSDVPINWADIDNVAQAAQLEGRLMIVMGELDENVLPGSTLSLVRALIQANKDFDLVYLPDTTHNGSLTPYATRRTWDYFVRNLANREPP